MRVLEGNYNGTPSHATTALDGIRRQFPGAEVIVRTGNQLPAPAGARAGRGTHHRRRQARPEGGILQRASTFAGSAGDDARGPDHRLRFHFPTPACPTRVHDFSVRWTGLLTAPESGTISSALDRRENRLWLDGKLVWTTPATQRPNEDNDGIATGEGASLRSEAGAVLARWACCTKLIWRRLIPDMQVARAGLGEERRCRHRRGRHHVRSRRRRDGRRCARLQGRRPHQSRPAQRRRRSAARP